MRGMSRVADDPGLTPVLFAPLSPKELAKKNPNFGLCGRSSLAGAEAQPFF
jgi:hypothetical protein